MRCHCAEKRFCDAGLLEGERRPRGKLFTKFFTGYIYTYWKGRKDGSQGILDCKGGSTQGTNGFFCFGTHFNKIYI